MKPPSQIDNDTVTEFIRSKMSCEIYFHVNDDDGAPEQPTSKSILMSNQRVGSFRWFVSYGGERKVRNSALSAVCCVVRIYNTEDERKRQKLNVSSLFAAWPRGTCESALSVAVQHMPFVRSFSFRIFLIFSSSQWSREILYLRLFSSKKLINTAITAEIHIISMLFVVFSSMKHRNFSTCPTLCALSTAISSSSSSSFFLSWHSSHPRPTSQ